MANRLMGRNIMSLEKAPVVLFAKVTIGGTGSPTLSASQSLGISAITRSAAGKYLVKFGGPAGVDSYQRLMSANVVPLVATTSAINGFSIVADNSASAVPHVIIQCVSGSAPAAADPASGEVLLMKFELSNFSGGL